jgi:hypothetical protein
LSFIDRVFCNGSIIFKQNFLQLHGISGRTTFTVTFPCFLSIFCFYMWPFHVFCQFYVSTCDPTKNWQKTWKGHMQKQRIDRKHGKVTCRTNFLFLYVTFPCFLSILRFYMWPFHVFCQFYVSTCDLSMFSVNSWKGHM